MKKKVLVLGLALGGIIATNLLGFKNSTVYSNQEARTITYDKDDIDKENLFEEFDSHEIIDDEDEMVVKAKKSFDKSIFTGLDLVGLENNSDSVDINYEVNFVEEESTVYLSISLESENGEEAIIETLPGLVTFNKVGETDVMFLDGEEEIWLSDLKQSELVDNTGFWDFIRGLINCIIESEPAKAVINTIAAIFAPFIRLVVTTLYMKGFGPLAAWIGGQILNMKQEVRVEKGVFGLETSIPTGIYHANFDCWQKNVSYDDFYDEVFDNGTSLLGRQRMERHKYEIDVDGDKIYDYILWAWKGDYYNLGAGCELGIYKKIYTSNFGLRWAVDTSKAFCCNLKLDFNKRTIINWNNDEKKHWWFTGFNSNYQFPLLLDITQLTASFEVTFNSFDDIKDNNAFYDNFYSSYYAMKNQNDPNWSHWYTMPSLYRSYNNVNYHAATLSF